MLYFVKANRLLKRLNHVSVDHIPRWQNHEANNLDQIASGYKVLREILEKLVEIKEKLVPYENVLDISSTSKLQGAHKHEDSQDLNDLEFDRGMRYEDLPIELMS